MNIEPTVKFLEYVLTSLSVFLSPSDITDPTRDKMSRASSADFLDSFIENISETKSSSHSLSTKSSRKSINNSLSRKSSQKLTLDRPVLPSLGPVNSSSRQSFRSGSSHEDDGEGLKPDLEVNWKRASKLATKFEIPNMTLTQEYVESDEESDIESDEESKIRQMAQRATLKRRSVVKESHPCRTFTEIGVNNDH